MDNEGERAIISDTRFGIGKWVTTVTYSARLVRAGLCLIHCCVPSSSQLIELNQYLLNEFINQIQGRI